MIKEIKQNNDIDWQKKITLEMTLEELTILTACAGYAALCDIVHLLRELDMNYTPEAQKLFDSYDSLEAIIKNYTHPAE